MKRNTAEALVHFWNSNGIDAALYENYSGRGYYGNTTTGVTLESRGDLLDGMLALINDPEMLAESKTLHGADDTCHSLTQDDLGKGVILY